MSFSSSPQRLRLNADQGVIYASWARPIPKPVQWTFLLFVAALAFEALPLQDLTAGTTLPTIFGFLFFVCYIVSSGIPFNLSLPKIPIAMWCFLLYFGVYALTGLAVQDEGIRAYVMRLFKLIQFFVLLWFGSDLLRDPKFATKCLLTLALACAFLATASLIGLPGFTEDVSGGRATSFDFSPNHLSALMAYAAVIIIGFCLKETGWSAKRKIFLLALTLPLFGLMVGTGSRAGIGAFIIGMSVFFIPHQGSRRQMIAFVVAVAAIAGVLYFVFQDPLAAERWSQTIEEGETAGRGDIYAAALDMFYERPFFGWGGREALQELGLRLGLLSRNRDAHNFILYLLIEVGLVGTIPFVVALWFCVRSAWNARTGRFGLLPLALVMTILAYNMTHTGITLKAFWLFLGFAIAASAGERDVKLGRVTTIRSHGPTESNRRSQRPARLVSQR